ncbi:hypothetical protein JHS3_09080 [Jeongeupia sp. HS-3]|uniref:hypothetical protein n=1 Tax=Jeongeupia sp. HS-3 TaxID=1009682 RepID=UPI0018A57645|nr:hypothetical protein [Jeongeupia sp. HS-3]BCL75172.1 hypothetical protein JHS3_09080 [Jeongeupia sp. HS-3]
MSSHWDFSACHAGVYYGCEHELRTSSSHKMVVALQKYLPGQVACLQEGGGFVNNLRVWENLILPAWYHESVSLPVLEIRVAAALNQLGVAREERLSLMAALPASLSRAQRRTLALVRTLVQSPAWLVVEVEWLAWLNGAADIHCKEAFAALLRQCPALLLGAGAMQHAESLPLMSAAIIEESHAVA